MSCSIRANDEDQGGSLGGGLQETEPRAWRGGVGGMWNEIGKLQFDYLVSQGLKPGHRLLDVGCGCLRGGIHFIRYLANGHYHGVDKNEYLLHAGRDKELPLAGLADRQVALVCRDDFDFSHFGVSFDFALAQSVFTHLPWNSILRCLAQIQTVLASDGRFYATFFEDVDGLHKASPLEHSPGNIITYPDSNPYHYEFSVFQDLAHRTGLRVENIGEWNHPRAQRMMAFRHEIHAPHESST